MAQQYRDPFFLVVVGRPRCGKSTWVREEVLKDEPRALIVPANRHDAGVTWANVPELAVKASREPDDLDPKGKDQLVVYAPDMDGFTGHRLLHVTEDVRRFTAVHHPRLGFRSGTLVMDDCKNYIKSNAELPSSVATMVRSRGHLELDIVCIVHSLDEINRQLIGYGCHIVVFATDLPPGDALRSKVRNMDELDRVIDRVNRRAAAGDKHYHELFVPSTYSE